MFKKLISLSLGAMLAVGMLAGCAPAEKKADDAPAATEAPAVDATEAPAAAATEAPVAATEAPATDTQEELFIPMISKGFQHQFWQAVKQGAEQAAKDFNVKISFEGPEKETEVARQLDMMNAALAQKPAAMCIAALDSQAAAPVIEKCKEQNIPVIGFDSGVDSDYPVATASTDNIAAAAAAADKMAELIGGKGKVFVLIHDQTSQTGIQRRDGFLNRMKEKYPEIEVLDVQYGEGNADKSAQIVTTVINSNPDLAGIYAGNEGSANGAVMGVKNSPLAKKVVLIGFDAGQIQYDAIKEGIMAGAISQNPVQIGYKAVEAAVKAARGEPIPEKNIDTGFVWYDATNIDTPEVQAVLYK